jgi:hypothetical protein
MIRTKSDTTAEKKTDIKVVRKENIEIDKTKYIRSN